MLAASYLLLNVWEDGENTGRIRELMFCIFCHTEFVGLGSIHSFGGNIQGQINKDISFDE